MRFYYFDSSALVKVYAWEGSSSEIVRAMVSSATLETPVARIIVCDIALAEVESALARKEADRTIQRAEAERLRERVRHDFLHADPKPYQIIHASSLIGDSGQWSRQYGLKSLDAIQLAAALAAKYSTPPGIRFIFVCADGRLCEAAGAENIERQILPVPQRQAPAGGA